ncbi:helix-turn-helix domain-containing protein [Marinomonas sp.]
MLAIPVPFVVSMLLGLLATTLYMQFAKQAKLACLFLFLCALTTALVGLRWTFDLAGLRIIQPIFAAIIPFAAWYVFAAQETNIRLIPLKHFIAPLFIILSATSQPWLALPLDEVLTLSYVCYGIALIRMANQETALTRVSLNRWEEVKKAKSVAGWMLIFSAMIDASMSLDFALNDGRLSLYILTTAHLILLPVLSIAVIIAGIHTPLDDDQPLSPEPTKADTNTPMMNHTRALEICQLLDLRIRQDSLFLDPELTLSRVSRKLTIPAKQISSAVNLIHQKNISSFINAYRIEHAQQALTHTDDPITQVLMNSGFQTKSNFHREFSRITGMTPSAYRKQTRTSD